MKIIAIDFGEVRTGIAICDEKETISYPLQTIVEKNEENLINKIKEIVIKNKAEMALVGLALNMNGDFGDSAKKCEEFAQKLKNTLEIPIALWDERQTTKLASRFLIEANTKKRKKKKIIDNVAATLILESFLQYKKNNNKIKLL